MKKLTVLLSVVILGALTPMWTQENRVSLKDVETSSITPHIAKLHIPFIANQGQTDESVAFYAKTFGGTVFVTKEGEIFYSLPKIDDKESAQGLMLKEELVGGNVDEVSGEGASVTRVNYFKGADPSKWKRNIPTYDSVNLGEIYRGIELKLKAYGNNVEKLFYINPNADPDQIHVRVNKAEGLKVNEEGELEVETGLGVVTFTKPVAFQETAGTRQYVEVAYGVKGDEYSFAVGDYDRTKTLVIDPLLASTFLGGAGGSGSDTVRTMSLDGSGNVYVAGNTGSLDFPITPGAYDTTFAGPSDVFVSKLDGNLQNLLTSTFLGSSDRDGASSIALDSSGNVYVAGLTWASDFPVTPSAFDTTFDGPFDGFVSKLDGNLQNLLTSTFLGHARTEGGTTFSVSVSSIVIDGSGNVYVAGATPSPDFPITPGAYDTTFDGPADGFVSKLDGTLQNLLASTFLGGTGFFGESICCIHVDDTGDIFVAGITDSSDFPTTPGAFDTTFNGFNEFFISKLDGNLQNLLASTGLGGPADTQGINSMSIDSGGNVYVAGFTTSSVFPVTLGAYNISFNGGFVDAFISKLDGNLQNLLASTFLGSAGDEDAGPIFIGASGNVYVAGRAFSSSFPTTPGAYDTTYNGSIDGFVSKLDSNLANLLASTFLGGSGEDVLFSISLDSNGNVYVAGDTDSSNFPTTPEAYDTTYNGGSSDAFISKLDSDLSASLPNIFVSSTSHDFESVIVGASSAPLEITISNTGTAALNIVGMPFSDPTNYTLDVNGGSNPCGSTTSTVVRDGSCTVTVAFTPASIGAKTATLTVNSDDPDTPNVSVSLTGNGISPDITVSPASHTFGVTGGVAVPLEVTVSNTGAATLNISGMPLSDTTNYALDVNGGSNHCGSTTPTIAPGGRCTVTVAFAPASTGTKTATLTINSDDLDMPSVSVSLTGTQFPIGDVSGDGSVTAYDASLILQFVVGLIDTFPVEALIGNSPKNGTPRDYEVSLPEMSLKAGEHVFVPVEINDTTGLTAGGLTLKYDSTVIRAVDVTFPIGQSYWEKNIDLKGEVRFAFVNADGTESADKLLLIEFEALPNTEGQTSPLILDQVQLLQSLSIKKINGRLTVLPGEFRLHQNYPNPFNPETWIPYDLADDANVSIVIYNAKGRQVRILWLGAQRGGSYTTKDRAAYWDGRSDTGEFVSSGIHFYRLQAGDFSAVRKLVILK